MRNIFVRDVIHSDIQIDEKMQEIIDTREFQRLHRIRQLSCDYFVFPTATHTRFSHSLGTYYVMKKLIAHFEQELKLIGYTVQEEDKTLAHVAALLHDLGHGAYSHAFERIFGLKSHEMWTLDILNDENTEIHGKIVKNYGELFLKRLLEIMSKSYKDESNANIFSIIATLVSSQTDADRMDYLLRDSYFTSVSNGMYDIDRLIKSFGVEEIGDSLRIYVNQKYMSTLEEYVLARYFMHNEVYQHATKKHMEDILVMIFKRAKQLILQDENSIFCDSILRNLFLSGGISIEDYIRTDDNYFNFHIGAWVYEKDEILSFLSNCFLSRKKFDIEIRDSKIPEKIEQAFKKAGIKHPEDEYFYSKSVRTAQIYAGSQNSIMIKKSISGEFCDLTDVSLLINKFNKDKGSFDERVFISSELFEKLYGIKL